MANFVITIARSFGSGGRVIGQMLSERLNVGFYDRDLIRLASDESGINESLFGAADEKGHSTVFKKGKYSGDIITPDKSDFVSDDNLFNYQAKIIKELADRESCIIVGRCADYILSGSDNVIRVFVYADKDSCIKTIMERYCVDEKQAVKMMEKTDRSRSTYYKYYTGNDWDNARNYDICLNSSRLGFDKCVNIIADYLKIRLEK